MKKTVCILVALVMALGACGLAFAETAALPAYTYPEDGSVWEAVVKHMQATDYGFEPNEGGVLIPTPVILRIDMNEEATEATVYGNFWIFTYTQKGKSLVTGPCGENPGVMKVKQDENGQWSVVSEEYAEDGENYQESIKKLCNGDKALEEEYAKSTFSREDNYVEQIQRSTLVQYITDNQLDITTLEDTGYPEPVDLTV